MPAYLIANIAVTNPDGYKEYAAQTQAMAEKYGGRYLIKGGPCEYLEGQGPDRFAVVEFPDVAAAKAWQMSDEYQAIIGIRHANSTGTVAIVEGV